MMRLVESLGFGRIRQSPETLRSAPVKPPTNPIIDGETLDWLETRLRERLNYILDPAPVADEPIINRLYTTDPEEDDSDDDSENAPEDNKVQTGDFCVNCHRLEQRNRFTPVAHLMRQYSWRSQPDIHHLIDSVSRGQCYFLSSVSELIDYLLELIYRRVQAQQDEARRVIGRLPFRQYLYMPGMPGASRSQSRLQYQHHQVPEPANQLSLDELRHRVRQLANRLDAVDAANILMTYGEKYHLGLK